MIQGIDHIGIIVRDLPGAVKFLRDVLGLEVITEASRDRPSGLQIAMLRTGGVDLELFDLGAPPPSFQPTDAERMSGGTHYDEKVVRRAAERRGVGVHHIAFRVRNAREAMKRFRELGLQLLDEAPRPGARLSQVFFVHPRSTGGILMHFVEREDLAYDAATDDWVKPARSAKR